MGKPQRVTRKPKRVARKRTLTQYLAAMRANEREDALPPRMPSPAPGRPGRRFHRNVACGYLGISRSTAIRYEKEGLLDPIKDTNKKAARVYYSYEDIAALMKRR